MKVCTVVDAFCGVGGLTHGFVTEGFNVAAGLDIDESCKYAYEQNNNALFIRKDIKRVTGKYLSALYPKGHLKVLVGCAPCQPFSTYNQKKNKRDSRWDLLYEFLRVIKKARPEIISMENVPQLRKKKVFADFLKGLKKMDYHVSYSVVYCPDYGIPQKRSRLVLLASTLGDISLINQTHTSDMYPTTRDAIGALPPLENGGVDAADPLHRARKLTEINLKRVRITPAGGDWRNWPQELVLACHKKESGKTFKRVYGRMKWDDQAPTMTTLCTGLGNGPFGHPDQDRAISFREAALIQTFPKGYKFIDPLVGFSAKNISKHIGNAVPVGLGRVIAKSIKKHMRRYDDA